MSNIDVIIEERAADIGGFLVGRLLPFRQKRNVGPFSFIDHMGPADMDDETHLDVPPHPHIGLSTLTYLFEGAIHHRDSLGTSLEIKPGAVNWMTAGKGIVHSERTPVHLRNQSKRIHGLQIWVALPKELEDMEPQFTHVPKEDLPTWKDNGVDFKLIAGEAFGKKSPVPVHSKLYFLELTSSKAVQLNLAQQLYGESGLYILEGSVKIEGKTYKDRQVLVSKNPEMCGFEMGENTTVYLFGGEVFPEERFIEWNFVSSDKEKIKEAKENWKHKRFPKVPKDDGYVAFPSLKK